MNYKKVMLVALVLLAVLTIGAVSASGDADSLTATEAGGGDLDVEASSGDLILSLENTDIAVGDGNITDGSDETEPEVNEGGNGEDDSFEVWVDDDPQGFDVSSDNLSGYFIGSVTVPENMNGNISIITENDESLFNKALTDFDPDLIRDNNIYDITLSDEGRYIFEGVDDGTLFRFVFLDEDGDEQWASSNYKLVVEGNTIWLEELNDDEINDTDVDTPEEELNNLIMDADEGSTLVLDKDYIFSGPIRDDTSIGIAIDKAMTIDGQGHTIDANNYCTIFAIDSPRITLANIIFRNGHVSDDWSGGAFGGGNPDLSVVNCTFENNIATDNDNAGAIAMMGDNIAIINSTFINNEGYNMGSILIQGNGAIISNCVFMNNRANPRDESETKGGAISIDGESATIVDCVFGNNTADLGSDIYIRGSSENFVIESCRSDAGDSSIYFDEGGNGDDDEFDPTKFSIDRRDDENNILALNVPVFSLYCPDGSEGTVDVTVSYNGTDYSVSKDISDMDENNYLHWYLNDLNMNLLVKYEITVNVNDGEYESHLDAYVHGPVSSINDKLYINTLFESSQMFVFFEVPSEYDDATVIVEVDGKNIFNKTLKEFEHADVANESYYWYHPSYGPGPGDERFKHYVVYNGVFGDMEAKSYNVTASIIFENSPIIGNHTFISTGTIDVVEGIVENNGVKMEAAHDRNYDLDDDEVSILFITAPEGANGKVTVSLNDKVIFESDLDQLDSEDGYYLLRPSKLELDDDDYELTFAYFEDDEKIVETSELFTFFHGGDEDPYQIEVEENFDIADPDTEVIKIHCPDGKDGYFVVIADNDEIKLRYDYTIREIDWDDDIHITASDLKLLYLGVYHIFVYHTYDLDDLEDCQIYEKWGAIEAIDYTQFRVIELDTFEPNALFINPIFAVYCPEGNEGNITVTVRQGDEEEPFIRSEKSISDKDDENKLYWTLSELNMDNKGEYFINVFYGDDDLQKGMRVEVVSPICFEEVSLINSTDHGRLVYVEIPSDIVDANITLIINGEEIFTKALSDFIEADDEAPYWDYMKGSGWMNKEYKRYFIENYHIGYGFSEDAYQMTVNLAIAGKNLITESAEVRLYNRNVVSNENLSIEVFGNQRYYLDNDWTEVVLINAFEYCGGNIVITVADNDWTFENPLDQLNSKNDEGDFQIYPCAFNGLGPGDYEITVAYFEGGEKILETSAFVSFYGDDDDEGDDSDDGVVIWVREGDIDEFDLSDEDDLNRAFAYVSVSNNLDGTIVVYCFDEEEGDEQDFFHIDLSEVISKYDDEERDGFTVHELSFNSLGDKLDDFKELGWFRIAFVTDYGDDESREVDSREYSIDYDDEANVIKFWQDDGGDDDPILDEIEFNLIEDDGDLIFERSNNAHVANLLIPDLEEFEGTVVNIIVRKNGEVVQEISTSDIEREDLPAAHRYPICIDLTKFDDMDDMDIEVDCFDYDGRLWEFTVEIDGDTVILHPAPEEEYYVFYGNITIRELNDPTLMGPHPSDRFVSITIPDLNITEGSIVVSYGDSVIEYSLGNCSHVEYENIYWVSLDDFDLMTLPENEIVSFTFNWADKSYTFNRIRQGDYLYKVLTPDDFDWQEWSNFNFIIPDNISDENGGAVHILGYSNMQSVYVDFGGGYFSIYVNDTKVENLGHVLYRAWLNCSLDFNPEKIVISPDSDDYVVGISTTEPISGTLALCNENVVLWNMDVSKDDINWKIGEFGRYYYEVNLKDVSLDGVNNGDELRLVFFYDAWGSELRLVNLRDGHHSLSDFILSLADLGITESGTYNIRITHFPSVKDGLEYQGKYCDGVENHIAEEYLYIAETELVNKDIIVDLGELKDSSIELGDIGFNYNETGSANVSLVGAKDITAFVVGHDEAKVAFKDGVITVSGLDAGNYTLNVTTVPEEGFAASSILVDFTVNKIDANLTVEADNVNVGETTTIKVYGFGIVKVRVGVNTYAINCTGVGYLVLSFDAGTYDVNVTFEGDNNINPAEAKTTFTVSKLSPEILITTGEAIEGNDLDVTVEIANATGIVAINGVNITLKDGKASTTIKDVAADEFDIAAVYFGDAKYVKANATKKVTVKAKENPNLIANVENINVGETAIVNIEINANVTGKVTVDGNKVAIDNGKGTYSISNLTAGTYTVAIAFAGDKYFNAANITKTFEVSKVAAPEIVIDVEESVVEGSDLAVDVTVAGATGTVNINGADVELKDGKASTTIKNVTVGDLTISVAYSGDAKYLNASKSTNVNVYARKDANLTARASNINVGDVAIIDITINKDATGKVTVNGDEVTIINGTAKYEIKDLTAGNYTYDVKFAGDKYFNAAETSVAFKVSKLASEVKITVGSAYSVGDSFTIAITNNTAVVVTINGNTYPVKDGKVDIDTTTLAAGSYTVVANITESDKYLASSDAATFTVSKVAAPAVVIDVESSVVEGTDLAVEVTVAGATGTVIINGEEKQLNNGKASAIIKNVTVGDLTINVAYSGDAKYLSASNSTSVNVFARKDAELTAVAADINVGEVAEISMTINKDVTGKLTVNGEEVTVVNGTVKYAVAGLTAGDHTFAVKFAGDMYFNATETTVAVKVSKLASSVKVTVGSVYNVGDSFAISIANSTAVKVIINGQEYAVKDCKVDIDTTKLAAGSYAVVASIAESDMFLASSDSASFEVKKVETPAGENPFNFDDNKTVESKTPTYSIDLPTDATGTLTVTVGGKNYTAEVVNGKATVAISDVPAGSYDVTITYSGDDKYSPIVKTSKATVKVDPRIDAKDAKVQYTAGKYYSVTVYGDDGKVAAGTQVIFTLNGKKVKTTTTDAKGVAKFKVTQVPVTNAKIVAKALGVSVTKKLTITHAATLKTITVKKSAKKITLRVTVKVNGKALKNKVVKFKFNNKYISTKKPLKTDKNGVATVDVPTNYYTSLKVGKTVTYQVTYLKDTVKKSTKVKK